MIKRVANKIRKMRSRRKAMADRLKGPTAGQRRWRLVKIATRSGLRRYPARLIGSFRRRPAIAVPPATASFEHFEAHSLAALWLGHATVLARLGTTNILIDPVLSDRIGWRLGRKTVGPRRLARAPARRQDLPPIDLLLVTHAHFDHLDRPTLRELASHQTTVITASRTRRLIPRGFGQVLEIAAGQTIAIDGLQIAAIRTAHWGSRRLIDWRRGYNSYLVRSASGSVLFAGDTALTDAFRGLGPIDLAVFNISSYDPWEPVHATPEQVWSMFCGMQAKRLLPVHHSTFRLGDEPVDEPMGRLLKAADGRADEIVQIAPGELWAAPVPGRPPGEEQSRNP